MTALRPTRSAASRVAGSLVALAVLAGCATPPPASDPEARAEWEQVNDPLEPMNRGIFAFNTFADTYAIRPAAEGYRAVVPQFGRDRIHDVLQNLKSPLIFANDLLQGEGDRAIKTLFRALMNTSFGLLGFIDIATEAGIPGHEEDFGQTLAVWGVGEGPYLVLPFLGPSNPRDALGTAVEWVGDPAGYVIGNVGYDWGNWARSGLSGLDRRERMIETLDDIERSSLDFYASLRSLYRQNRAAEISNGHGRAPLSPPVKGDAAQ